MRKAGLILSSLAAGEGRITMIRLLHLHSKQPTAVTLLSIARGHRMGRMPQYWRGAVLFLSLA